MAPIENFWSELKHRVYSKGRPETMRILKARVRKECRNPDWFPWLTAAIDSLPQRMQDVIVLKEGIRSGETDSGDVLNDFELKNFENL